MKDRQSNRRNNRHAVRKVDRHTDTCRGPQRERERERASEKERKRGGGGGGGGGRERDKY